MTMERRLPFDDELERSVLAELAEPLHVLHVLDGVEPRAFLDPRRQRALVEIRGGDRMTDADRRHMAECVRHAWPLTRGAIERYLEIAERRARILELEREIDDLVAYAS